MFAWNVPQASLSFLSPQLISIYMSVNKHTECRRTASITLPSDLHITLVSALSYCLVQNLLAFPTPLTPTLPPGSQRCSTRVILLGVNRPNSKGNHVLPRAVTLRTGAVWAHVVCIVLFIFYMLYILYK
jgi:hypothetical protein